MKTIMFFGDSNTWGYDSATGRRYPEDVRFTGIIREKLKDCRIIEEGLKGRTNSLEDSQEEGKNGYKALPMLLCTHDPIDIFVIMLGTNDVKRAFNCSAFEIAKALERNVNLVQAPQFWDAVQAPRILIISPPGVTEDFRNDHNMSGNFDIRSVEISKELAEEYQRVARTHDCEFLNAMDYTGPGQRDGVHLDEDGHARLARALEDKLREMLG